MLPFDRIKCCYVIDKSVTGAQSAQSNMHPPRPDWVDEAEAVWGGVACFYGFLFLISVTFLKLVTRQGENETQASTLRVTV